MDVFPLLYAWVAVGPLQCHEMLQRVTVTGKSVGGPHSHPGFSEFDNQTTFDYVLNLLKTATHLMKCQL